MTTMKRILPLLLILVLFTAVLLSAVPFSSATVESPEARYELLGDADGDGKVNIMDSTRIQRWLAMLCNPDGSEYSGAEPPAAQRRACDADGDDKVTILDATAIQRHLAGLPTSAGIGEPFGALPVETTATEPVANPTAPAGDPSGALGRSKLRAWINQNGELVTEDSLMGRLDVGDGYLLEVTYYAIEDSFEFRVINEGLSTTFVMLLPNPTPEHIDCSISCRKSYTETYSASITVDSVTGYMNIHIISSHMSVTKNKIGEDIDRSVAALNKGLALLGTSTAELGLFNG
jgi:hypothetical protein